MAIATQARRPALRWAQNETFYIYESWRRKAGTIQWKEMDQTIRKTLPFKTSKDYSFCCIDLGLCFFWARRYLRSRLLSSNHSANSDFGACVEQPVHGCIIYSNTTRVFAPQIGVWDTPGQGRNQLFISRGGNYHEISFDDVIVLIQPWYNLFANGHL